MVETLVWGVFGAIVGSFLNVLILRWGTERSIVGIGRPAPHQNQQVSSEVQNTHLLSRHERRGRGDPNEIFGAGSACMTCGNPIRWYDLVPVMSWVALRGRCRDCGARVSVQYPLVELSTGIVFALIGAAPIDLLFKLIGLPIAALLIAIAAYDIRTTIIPDAWAWPLNGFAFLSALAFITSSSHLPPSTWQLALLAGPLAALPLFLLWYISKGRWMGLGDPKLALSIGWLLGFPGGVNAVLLAFIIGALICAPLLFFSSAAWERARTFIPTLLFQKKQLGFTIGKPGFLYRLRSLGNENTVASSFLSARWTMKSEIPFGPFLVAACFIVWFSQMYTIALPFVW